MTSYRVIRTHWGDKKYKVGDTREAKHADVAHLIGRCLLEEKAEKPKETKTAKPLKNKAVK